MGIDLQSVLVFMSVIMVTGSPTKKEKETEGTTGAPTPVVPILASLI